MDDDAQEVLEIIGVVFLCLLGAMLALGLAGALIFGLLWFCATLAGSTIGALVGSFVFAYHHIVGL
jgi:hypothetical protein